MKKILATLGCLVLFCSAFTILPANATDPSTIFACANADHSVRLVSDDSSCNGSETEVEWGTTGPEGPSDGYDSQVAGTVTITSGSGWITAQSQSLPAGSYVLNAVASIYSGSGTGCRLYDGTNEIDFRYFAPVNGTGNSNPMGSVTVGYTTTIYLECQKTISNYQVTSSRITAIKVGTLH